MSAAMMDYIDGIPQTSWSWRRICSVERTAWTPERRRWRRPLQSRDSRSSQVTFKQVTDDVVRLTVQLNAPEEEKSDDELSTPEMALCSDEDRLDELDSEDDRELRAEEAEELDSPELTRELGHTRSTMGLANARYNRVCER